jgi:N-acetyl-D-muramate 6-phosphate phosphatase
MKLSVPRALLFDLDGTLVDTAPDLLAALSHVRTALGLDATPPAHAGGFVSAGALAMLRAGLPAEFHDQLDRLRDVFLQHYQANVCVHSKPYRGVRAFLQRMEAQGVLWGVITNKPFYLAEPLLKALKLKPAVLLGGDSLPTKKPDPAPLQFALKQLGVAAGSAWMIGDDPRDIEAGKNAGCAATIACAYGYLGDAPPIEQWGASWIAQSVDEFRL